MSESNGYATRDEILSAPPTRRFKDVVIEGLGKFRIRSLSALEANTVQAKALAAEDTEQKIKEFVATNIRYIVQSVVDSEGHRIFSDTDVAKLLDLDARQMAELARECQKHSEEKSVSVEDAEKNSAPIAV